MLSSILLSTLLTASAQATEIVPKAKPYIMVQSWATLYDQDEYTLADPASYGDPEDDFGMKIRRGRAGFTGASDVMKYSVIMGVASPFDAVIGEPDSDIRIIDANFAVKPVASQPLWITTGMQKVPVSREQIMSSGDLVLAERAVSSIWMVPNRETGVVLDYRIGEKPTRAKIQVGVFNGNGSFFGDNGSGKLIASRVEVMSGRRSSYKTFGVVDNLVVGAAGDFYLNSDIATDTVGYGGDALIRFQGLAVLGEFRMGKISPTNSDLADPGILAETEQMGYLAQVGYTVKDYEMAVRYSTFDDNKSLANAGDVAALRAGVTWHGPEDIVRAGLGYEKRMEPGSDEIRNDSVQMWFQFLQQ